MDDLRARLAEKIKARFAERGKPITPAMLKQRAIDAWMDVLTEDENKWEVERDPNDPSRVIVTVPPRVAEMMEMERRRLRGEPLFTARIHLSNDP